MNRIRLFYHLFAATLLLPAVAWGQGASVAPSRLFYNTNPGQTETQTVRVTNTSGSKQAFTISFADFEPEGNLGKTRMVREGESVHTLKNVISAAPNFFELEPGETKEIAVSVGLANVPESNTVKWGSMLVKLAREKDAGGVDNNMGFGIMESFQFVVYVFQTPPSVNYKKAEIVGFASATDDRNKAGITLEVENTGDAILNCASYVELTSVTTGELKRIGVKAFTMLPDTKRELFYAIPDTIPPGKYSALGVVDFGSREEIEAAELEIVVSQGQ